LLAIISKNDATNVTWNGAVLNYDHFAGIRINWKMKVENVVELAKEMNLNTNSFIFVDDRCDERAMVSSAYPEILTLDSGDTTTWRRLVMWQRMLSGIGAIDARDCTKKRIEREKFVSSNSRLSKAGLFEQLALKCTVTLCAERKLPRVTELLNRTNQFNTTGRRTSLKEVQGWYKDPKW
jgi:FkbH-like protein